VSVSGINKAVLVGGPFASGDGASPILYLCWPGVEVVTKIKGSALHAGFGFLHHYAVAPEVDDVVVDPYVASAVRAVAAGAALWRGLSPAAGRSGVSYKIAASGEIPTIKGHSPLSVGSVGCVRLPFLKRAGH
jgi:hypothetical protein